MLNKMQSTSMLVVLILISSVVSHPAISEAPSDKAENNNSDNETSPEGRQDSSRLKFHNPLVFSFLLR